MGRSKDTDEVFCTACGVRIKRAAGYCPHCGVANEWHDPSAAPARTHEHRVRDDSEDRDGDVDRDRNRNVDRDRNADRNADHARNADHVRNADRDGDRDSSGDQSPREEPAAFDQRTPSEVQATRDAASVRDTEGTHHGAAGRKSPTRERAAARSGRWWYGVAAFGATWALVLGAWATGIQHGALAGLALLAWAGLPASLARDIGFTHRRSAWEPSRGPWAFGALVPGFNLVVALVYLIRRREVLGTP